MKKQKNTSKRPRIKRVLLILLNSFLVLLISFLASLHISNTCIKVSYHIIESEKVNSPIRIAVVSDLHSKVFEEDNTPLYAKIAENNPHLIFAVGDMITKSHTEPQYIDALGKVVSSLCEIAPVYYSLGNHELSNPLLEEIKLTIAENGAVLLENETEDIDVNGNTLRLMGLSYYRSWDKEQNRFLYNSLQDSENIFSVLLCHFPEFYIWGIKNHSVDLTVSGHTHGGMVKLPLIGPLFAPEQGWFPKYAAGFYEMENGYLAVTTGLGSSPENLPRVFNRPEIMIIDVK